MEVNKRKQKDFTVDQIQYVIDCHLRNLITNENGNHEIDGKLKVKDHVARQLAIKLDTNISTIHRWWHGNVH
jgi:hypothetical protein